MCTIVFPEVAAKKLICSPSANTLASHWEVLSNYNLQIILLFIKNVPSGDVLGLTGYTQSSGPGELSPYDALSSYCPSA